MIIFWCKTCTFALSAISPCNNNYNPPLYYLQRPSTYLLRETVLLVWWHCYVVAAHNVMMVMDRTRIKTDKESGKFCSVCRRSWTLGSTLMRKFLTHRVWMWLLFIIPLLILSVSQKRQLNGIVSQSDTFSAAFFVAKLSRSYFRSVCLFVCWLRALIGFHTIHLLLIVTLCSLLYWLKWYTPNYVDTSCNTITAIIEWI